MGAMNHNLFVSLGAGIQTKAHFRLPSGWSLTLMGLVHIG
jgi:hypothetical protein